MTVAALAFAAILGLTAAGILIPILLRRQAAGVLRDELPQVERDRSQGLIGPAESAAAEAEIGRALLANAREAGRPGRIGQSMTTLRRSIQ
jgi:cytochrome c-type biogenesis protein CcmI